ncbi:MAG: DNA polymerase III subunit delta [Salinivirgaceae bacterium]|nr:DNA polymerase III subunit delta [Salinivirgaceae bacterium]
MYTFEQILGDLKKKIYKPIYYLMGDESYFIDSITEFIDKNILPEDEKSFNQTVFYGKDIDMGTLLNTARRFPMMSNYNVIILREAQNLKGIDGLAAGETDPFLLYAENPPTSTILVVNYKGKSLDKRKKIYKTLDKNAVLFESKSLYENKVGAWIQNYVKTKGLSIDVRASELMASHLGNNLSKVVNEVEKLLIVTPKNGTITLKEIEEHVGISKDFNIFELQNALGKKDVYGANLIITHLGQNPKTKSIIPLISFLYSYFTKILMVHSAEDKSKQSLAALLGVNPFFVQDYISAARTYSKPKCAHIIGFLREYDAKSKGIDAPSVDDFELMRELIYKILHI